MGLAGDRDQLQVREQGDNSRLVLAFDRSARTIDRDGHLHVKATPISKACVNPYSGHEIPRYKELGLTASKVYYLLRDPEELAKGAPTFDGKPLLIIHKAQSAADHDHQSTAGAISNPFYEAPYLKADLCVWPEDAIAGIETEAQRELSSSYYYDAVMEPGEFEGQAYDGRMTNIVANHVALVERGRAGSDVLVCDSLPKELKPMLKKSAYERLAETAKAQADSLRAQLANDSALKPIVATFDKLATDAAAKAKDCKDDEAANDEPMDVSAEDSEEEKAKKAKEAKEKADKEKAAEDEAAAAKAKADKADKDKEGKAMDAATVDQRVADAIAANNRKHQDIAAARDAVRPVVGDVSVAMDSADAIYRMAFDHLGIDHKGIPKDSPASVLRTLLDTAQAAAAPRKQLAMDSGPNTSFAKRFPDAPRVRHM
jgi:hypothetical protein